MTSVAASDTGDGPPASRTERRKAATQAALCEAVVELLLASERPRLSSRLIADQADVAVGTFYNHFKTVDEAVDAALAPLSSRADRVVGEIPQSTDPIELLGTFMARFLCELQDEPRLWMAARRAGWELEPSPGQPLVGTFIDIGAGVEDTAESRERASRLAARMISALIDDVIAAPSDSTYLPEQFARMIGAVVITDPAVLEQMVGAAGREYRSVRGLT